MRGCPRARAEPRAGAVERLGLGDDALKDAHPRLIACDLSGYGDEGPYRDRKAYDLLIQSEAGCLSITGSPGQPAKAGCSIADIAAGMSVHTNIPSALPMRGRTGTGCRIDMSMPESMVAWMGYRFYYAIDGQSAPAPSIASHATICPYGPFPAGGKTVMLGLQNEREWKLFCEQVLRQPALADDPRFDANSKRHAAHARAGVPVCRGGSPLPAFSPATTPRRARPSRLRLPCP
ncbi:CoA transferase [Burkholderia arboris]|uniref:CoA transferase n=1 Tax=Burkholderia arboris TaxID=488730 RepID=A0A9Q9UV38_9BURK|nr:CoA transferase [Burkholderia arboris]